MYLIILASVCFLELVLFILFLFMLELKFTQVDVTRLLLEKAKAFQLSLEMAKAFELSLEMAKAFEPSLEMALAMELCKLVVALL